MARRSVLLVHGINSRGEWYEPVADVLEPHLRCVRVYYPQYVRLGWLKVPSFSALLALPGLLLLPFALLGLPWARLRPWAWAVLLLAPVLLGVSEWLRRRAALAHVRTAYDAVRRTGEVPHVLAHSLGTYLTGRLLGIPGVRYGRVVFVGSPLPRGYWNGGRLENVGQVRNEVGRSDVVPLSTGLASRMMPGFGDAGWAGFAGPADRVHTLPAGRDTCDLCALAPTPAPLVHNAAVGEFTHSDAFIGTGYAERFWLPFFLGAPGHELAEFYEACALARRLEEEGNWPELERQEAAFRGRRWRLWGEGWEAAETLPDYIRRYVACWCRLTGLEAGAENTADWTDRAVRLTWLAVAEAREEREKPPAERDPGRLHALHPVQAVRRAVEAARAGSP